ncbi:hypothetical protein LXA43DRAFT_907216, partial [Ganoderma leucocontextum]
LPLIWIKFVPEATRDHESALKKYTAALVKHHEAQAKYDTELGVLQVEAAAPDLPPKTWMKLVKKVKELMGKAPNAPAKPVPWMQELEVPLMLMLATSLKLLLGTSTTPEQCDRGAKLLFQYLKDFKSIYGPDTMVPNYHYASHIPAQLKEYATVYEIWAFLGERLNKMLKSSNLNNRCEGQQEVTMMREFDHNMQVQAVVSDLLGPSELLHHLACL